MNYCVSFVDDAGEEFNRRRGNVVYEQMLKNPFSAAWLVGRAVRDFILEAQ